MYKGKKHVGISYIKLPVKHFRYTYQYYSNDACRSYKGIVFSEEKKKKE